MNTHLSLCLSLVACAVLSAALNAADWVNITTDLDGDYGWARGSNSTIAVAPGSDAVWTWIGKMGPYSTSGGKTWEALLDPAADLPSEGIVNRFVFDPADPKTCWISLMYGKGLFKTTDGGHHFTAIGGFSHLDGLTIDFSDPARKTMVIAQHEQSRSLVRSKDGGKSWRGIGMNLPENTKFTTWPLLLSADILLTNTSGWGGGSISGIWRSTNCGDDWTKVSDLAPVNFPLVTAQSTVLYPVSGGLARSTDHGVTWTQVQGPSGPAIQLPDARIAAMAGRQLMVSADDGQSWKTLGPPCPGDPSGIGPNVAYQPGHKAFIVCVSSDANSDKAMWRLSE